MGGKKVSGEKVEGMGGVSSSWWDNKHVGSKRSYAALPAICQAGLET